MSNPANPPDHSRMMIDLAETLVLPGPVDLDDLGRRFVAWMEEQPKDIGNTTRLAIELLRDGASWDRAGQMVVEVQPGVANLPPKNGSVMRCAPVAIRYRDQLDALRTVSIDTARITHAEPRCTWSAVAINQAVAFLLEGGPAHRLIAAAVAGIEQPEVVAEIEAAPGLAERDLSGTGFVLNAVKIAFCGWVNRPTFEEAVVSAVMIGDDTDTNAAVTGALAGALHGYARIPERWRSAVSEHDRLIALADQLLAVESLS